MDQLIRIPGNIDYFLYCRHGILYRDMHVVDQRNIETVARACLFVARTHGNIESDVPGFRFTEDMPNPFNVT